MRSEDRILVPCRYKLSFWLILAAALVAPLKAPSGAALAAEDSAAARSLEIAPFARVITCDPNRMDGARSNRLQEFPAVDVFLEENLARDAQRLYEVPATGGMTKDGKTLVWQIDADHVPEFTYQKGERGTEKVRWIWPGAGDSCAVRRPAAKNRHVSTVGKFRLELERPRPGQQAVLETYNGYWADGAATPSPRTWDLGQPLTVAVRYAVPPNQADRTLVRFEMPRTGFPEAGFSVALEDVLAGGVLVRDFGVYVTPEPAPQSLAEYKHKIADRRTTLEKVRLLPDQTFERARKELLNPLCARDPMILSLA